MVSLRLSSLVAEAEGIRGDPEAALGVAERLHSVLREEARGAGGEGIRVEGGVRVVEARQPMVVVGDIHGDLDTLVLIMEDSRMLERLDKGHVAVFLGDYVDRGPAQIEVMVLLTRLKETYGERVVMLRGNHEPPPGLNPYPHDFPWQLVSLYGEQGREVYRVFYEAFQHMPYAAVAWGRAMLMHGGLPTHNYAEAPDIYEYLEAGRKPSPLLLEEILWNDPDEYVDEWAPSPRGAGRLFGPRVTESVCSRMGCSMVVRGHEPCDAGYKYNHGGRVLTLFSRRGPPYMNRKAAYAVLRPVGDGFEHEVRTV